MKILIFSDSHGFTATMIDAINENKPDNVIFLGDVHSDCNVLSRYFPTLAICEVCGNNDWFCDVRTEAVVTYGGIKFFITHGHKYGVKSDLSALAAAAKRNGCTVALYGHTHIRAQEDVNGVLCVNPGSVGYSDGYIIMEIKDGKLEITNVN